MHQQCSCADKEQAGWASRCMLTLASVGLDDTLSLRAWMMGWLALSSSVFLPFMYCEAPLSAMSCSAGAQ